MEIEQMNERKEGSSTLSLQETSIGLTMKEAIAEAQPCLHCKVPQCRRGCPIENDIPDIVHEV